MQTTKATPTQLNLPIPDDARHTGKAFEVSNVEAEALGAFPEDALTEQDVIDSAHTGDEA